MKAILILLLLASLNAGAQTPKDTIIVNRQADGRLFLSDSFLHIYSYDTSIRDTVIWSLMKPHYDTARVLISVSDTLYTYANDERDVYTKQCWEVFKSSPYSYPESLGYFMDDWLPLPKKWAVLQTIVLSYKNYSK